MTARLIIAIDGPAAAGKGTLARRLAEALDLPYLDTGRLYRAVGRLVLDAGRDPSEPEVAAAAARRLKVSDLERDDLRDPAADSAATAVAAVPAVRSALIEFQRNFGGMRGAVLDGRDIGTVIFPEAPVKLLVTASLAARAERRWRELQERGLHVGLAEVEEDMRQRDQRDAARGAAPLRQAADAVRLDTTDLDPEQVFIEAMRLVRARLS